MGQGYRLSGRAILGIAICVFAALFNLTQEDTGGPMVALVWVVLAVVVFVVARSRAEKRAAEARQTTRPDSEHSA